MGFTCQDYGEGLVIFVNSDYFGIFADPSHQPEWRNGRRDGLKIHCPLKACGFESRLGHEQGKNRSYFFDYSRVANGFSFSDVLPALLAPAGRYYVDPSPNPFPRGRDLVGLQPPRLAKAAGPFRARGGTLLLAQQLLLSPCTPKGEGEGSPSAAAQLSPLSSLRDSEGGRFGPECGVCRPKAVKNQPIRPEKPIFRPVVPPKKRLLTPRLYNIGGKLTILLLH